MQGIIIRDINPVSKVADFRVVSEKDNIDDEILRIRKNRNKKLIIKAIEDMILNTAEVLNGISIGTELTHSHTATMPFQMVIGINILSKLIARINNMSFLHVPLVAYNNMDKYAMIPKIYILDIIIKKATRNGNMSQEQFLEEAYVSTQQLISSLEIELALNGEDEVMRCMLESAQQGLELVKRKLGIALVH